MPRLPAGDVAAQLVVVLQLTKVAALKPNLALVDPTTNPVPVNVTTVPPPSGPADAFIAVTVGMTS